MSTLLIEGSQSGTVNQTGASGYFISVNGIQVNRDPLPINDCLALAIRTSWLYKQTIVAIFHLASKGQPWGDDSLYYKVTPDIYSGTARAAELYVQTRWPMVCRMAKAARGEEVAL